MDNILELVRFTKYLATYILGYDITCNSLVL